MDLIHLVEALQHFTTIHPAPLAVKHAQTLCVAVTGKVSTTSLTEDSTTWRTHTAASVATWWLQNPGKPYQALTTAVLS
jgi:hypothetical protein